jgi:hypothetical protein
MILLLTILYLIKIKLNTIINILYNLIKNNMEPVINTPAKIEQFESEQARNDVRSHIEKRKRMESFMNNIDQIIEDINKDPLLINTFSDEEILEIHKKLNPYTSTIVNEGDKKYTCMSYTNLREQYLEKLLTTSLVGYLYRMNDEYEVEEEYLNEEINESDFIETVDNPNMLDEGLVKSKTNELYFNKKFEHLKQQHEGTDVEINIDNVNSFTLDEETELRIMSEINREIKEEIYKPLVSINKQKMMVYKEEKIKEQSIQEQKIIKRFLNRYFDYNPDRDIKSSYNKKEASKDTSRSEINKIYKDFETKETVTKDINDTLEGETRTLLKRNTKSLNEEELLTDKIPPKEFYKRFQHYYELNYETLRNCVKNIYGLVPDLEIAFNIYGQFNSIDEADKFIDKNKKNVITSIKTITNNSWVFTGPFEQNMEKRKFYNENTAVLENILNQMDEDAKMANDMMKDRINKKKLKNIKEMGEDDPKFSQYKSEYGNSLKIQGATDMEIAKADQLKKIRVIEEEEVGDDDSKLDEDGCPLSAVEIKVTHINARTNETNVETVYTKAVAPS